MIPLVLNDGRPSFIYVQTKFGKSYDKEPSDEDVAKVSPHYFFRDALKNFFSKTY
jgi:hypothetical protein